MSDIEFDYEYLAQRALKRVIFDVLTITAELNETPGEHHFYIEFSTTAAGVAMPDDLRESYPELMTIVIQHQFEALEVNEDGFAVTLWFKGKPARLSVPFDAVTSFADPSVSFGLRFAGASPPQPKSQAGAGAEPQDEGETEEDKDAGAEVVSLDSFRKK